MVDSNSTVFGNKFRYQLFTVVKYLVYLLLGLNVYLFLQEELFTLAAMGIESVSQSQLVQVFSATIDTAAWVILLLLFELETSVLDDSRIRGPVRWSLHGIRGLCYLVIVFAFLGYIGELGPLYDVLPFSGEACALADQGWLVLTRLDEFVALDGQSCSVLGSDVYQLQGTHVLAGASGLETAQRLAWVDVINAGVWILVVLVLEIEVRLQLRGMLSGAILQLSKYLKFVLYGVLFAAAVYWGVFGRFLDFWDASLWLFAFIFIELNVFEWQYESRQDSAS
ncbi:MAG: hypothetical protein R6W80_00870 [Haliea sp.]